MARRRSNWPACVAFAACAALFARVARADEPVSLEVPARPAHVGDVVTLTARVPVRPGEAVVPADLGGSLGKLAVRAVRVVAPAPDAADKRPALLVEVQAFEVGTVEVPPVPFQVRAADGQLTEGTTTSAQLEVASVRAPGETDPKPADLAPPAELSFDRAKLVKLTLAIGALLALGALLGWWLVRRFGGRKMKPAPPPIPADVRALRDLEELLGGSALTQGDLRRFHIELAAILKRYLEDRFRFPAVEHTTGEVERDLRRLGVDALAQQPAIEVLRDCDRVKFANAATTADESRARAAHVQAVVDRTRVAVNAGAERPTAEGS